MLLPTGRLHDLLPVSCVVVLSLFSTSHLLAISPTGAFAIWVFRVSEECLTTMNGEYFQDLDEAVAAWKKIT